MWLADLSDCIGGCAGIVPVVLTLQAVPGQAGGLAAAGEGGDGGGQDEACLSLGPGDGGGRVACHRGIYSLQYLPGG